ncbi:MAG: PDZ domain-containing protein [Cyanobacteriota bacterium]|nr:PDZ domain-containing protein [Cyanobacteriota bacterium]
MLPLLSLDLRAPHQHLIRARLRVQPRQRRLELRLPGWTPGSYLIRDYVRTLEGLTVWQGSRPLDSQRLAPATWLLRLTSLEPLEVRYAIQASELTVRTCHLNSDHGFLALAGVALEIEGERWQPHGLDLQLPPGWEAFLPLPQVGDHHWRAESFDALIDSPVEVGPHPVHGFQVAGVEHRWVTWGGDPPAIDPAWLPDVERVCGACCRLLGEARPPGDPYLFVLHLLEEGYGGLEHNHASVLQYSRGRLATPEGRRKLLGLVAHEYLHQWNVRRLRPVELSPVDYGLPVPVPTLWFAEGVTSYYDLLLPGSCGLCEEADTLADLGEDLNRYLLCPGRAVQSLRDSSLEAWVKLYRQDAYSSGSQVSYYLKGAVVALVLDLHLRRHGSALSQVLRRLWERFGRWDAGYREDDLLASFTEQAEDLSTLLPQWLRSTEDPDMNGYLADVGLELRAEMGSRPTAGWQLDPSPEGGLRLKTVARRGAAEHAGLEVGDELLALDRRRVRRVAEVEALLASADPSPSAPPLTVLFTRQGLVRETTLVPEPPAIERWRLLPLPDANSAALERRRQWLELVP